MFKSLNKQLPLHIFTCCKRDQSKFINHNISLLPCHLSFTNTFAQIYSGRIFEGWSHLHLPSISEAIALLMEVVRVCPSRRATAAASNCLLICWAWYPDDGAVSITLLLFLMSGELLQDLCRNKRKYHCYYHKKRMWEKGSSFCVTAIIFMTFYRIMIARGFS